jgi:fucose permease
VPFSGLGLFVTGLGVAVLYPLGIAAALAGAPGQAALAGNRLTMATGTALLFAPFALGAIADLAGVVAGWSVVPGLVALALVLLFVLPRERVAGATAEG